MAGGDDRPILVTGAAGRVGSVGRQVVQGLRRRGLPVRALVHHEDDRAEALRATGAGVVVGDLLRPVDVAAAMDGCRSVFFSLSLSASYLRATVTAAAMARAAGPLEAFVNMSQFTVSEMTATSTAESDHQRLQWLSEQVLDWSGLPVVEIRPTVFMENPFFTALAAASIVRDGTIRLPFESGRTSPVAAGDVARVVETVLTDPAPHVGRAYRLTGPRSETGDELADDYAGVLGRPVSYADVPLREWLDRDLAPLGLDDHTAHHIATMARLHAENRYDRRTHDVEAVTGRPALDFREFLATRLDLFEPARAGRARRRAG